MRISQDAAHAIYRLGLLGGVALAAAAVCLGTGAYWVLIPCALCYTGATISATAKIYRPEDQHED